VCGLVGIFSRQWQDAMSLQDTAVQMAEAIRHRGPDGGGSWSDAACGIALAHRRLSIVDLSQAGQQPMLSGSGRFVISFNGEIYNHRDLRVQLEKAGVAIVWRGGSDTETLLWLGFWLVRVRFRAEGAARLSRFLQRIEPAGSGTVLPSHDGSVSLQHLPGFVQVAARLLTDGGG
jgi:glutamine phosphoribosylpyrophosphate amidotransferase